MRKSFNKKAKKENFTRKELFQLENPIKFVKSVQVKEENERENDNRLTLVEFQADNRMMMFPSS
jgi:glycyl-tRNA synthetase beta subunit